MAETSQHHQSIEESEERPNVSPAERDQWESTELSVLAHTRQNYTRASSSHALGPGSTAPTGFIGQFTYSISKFWRHQISVTVDHVTCRDHLGTYHYLLFIPLPMLFIRFVSDKVINGIRRSRAEILLSAETFISSTEVFCRYQILCCWAWHFFLYLVLDSV